MENNKKVHYGWQTLLLCVFVSVSHPVLAKPSPVSSTEKHHTRKPTNAKRTPAGSTVKEKSTTPATQQRPQAKTDQLHKKDKIPPASSVKHLPIKSQKVEKSKTKSGTNNKLGETNSDRVVKSRSIVVLKETKQRTMVKTVVALPLTYPDPQNRKLAGQENSALRKSHKRTIKETRLLSEKSQQIRSGISRLEKKPSQPQAFIAQAAKLRESSLSVPLPPKVPNVETVTSLPDPPSSSVSTKPEISLSQAVPPTVPANQGQSGTPTAPSSPPLAVVTSVERVPATAIHKDEPRQKEWSGYTPERSSFAVTFNDERLTYRISSTFVLPGDEIFLAVNDPQKKAEYSIRSSLGPERLLASRRWYWNAPTETGLYPVKITNTRTGSSVTLNVFVMAPLAHVQDGHLNGYRIGNYPTEPLRQLAMYTPPRGLIEVTRENEDTLVSPHFRLRQFLCKQDGDYPKYMILDARLLSTLEQLLEMINAQGYRARTFSIMSGYRTPYYNRAIGNRTTYSRHLWGDAADIFIDEEPRDGKMDDLNQDGVIDAHDADIIYQLIEDASDQPRFQKIAMGGLARYRETSSHGPFIHVDARGSYARWGLKTLTRGGTTPTEAAFQSRSQSSFWDPQSTTEPTP